MYKKYDGLTTPDEKVTVWRYMDFTKFVHLITYGGLWFSPVSSMTDKTEGRNSRPFIEIVKSAYSKKGVPSDLIETAFQSDEFINERALVNCWHINNYESAPMWKFYLKSNQGLAIQTTVGDFKKAIENDPEETFLAKVNYVDYEKSIVGYNFYQRSCTKSMSYLCEQELRALIYDFKTQGNTLLPARKGLLVKTDLTFLIQEIVIAPMASSWILDLTKELVKNIVDVNVRKSELHDVAFQS